MPIKIVAGFTTFRRHNQTGLADIFHDRPQTLIDLLGGPVEEHSILRHLQAGHRHTTGIGGFGRSKQQFFAVDALRIIDLAG